MYTILLMQAKHYIYPHMLVLHVAEIFLQRLLGCVLQCSCEGFWRRPNSNENNLYPKHRLNIRRT